MDLELLGRFDTHGLDRKNTVVRCETREEANIFLRYLAAKGVWGPDRIVALANKWDEYGPATCYHFSEESWCYDAWYKRERPSYRIVNFCDIYKDYDLLKSEKNNVPVICFSFDELMQGAI